MRRNQAERSVIGDRDIHERVKRNDSNNAPEQADISQPTDFRMEYPHNNGAHSS